MATEGGWDPPPPRDELLDELKWTAPQRERQAQARRWRRRPWLVGGGCMLLLVAAAVTGILRFTVLVGQPAMHLPSRVGDLARIESAVLGNLMTNQLEAIEKQDARVTQASGAFYGNDPQHPDVMLLLLRAHHTDDDVTQIRGDMEAPLVRGVPSTPDGPHTVSATVNGVDFVCEPVIENGDSGPIGERTDCTWDDHGQGIGVLVDFTSGESSVILKEVEAVQPGAID